jgi:gamma-glutamylcyclotransferase (GGCT)/AIG2-like uncharacterized protein YtfP
MVKLFAYGTLRPGGSLKRSLLSAYLEPAEHAMAHGHLFHHAGSTDLNPSYPVADFSIMDGSVIHGDVLTVDVDNFQVQRTTDMEVRAGYQTIETEVTLDSGEKIKAIAFHYPYKERGARIIDGDWMPFELVESRWFR